MAGGPSGREDDHTPVSREGKLRTGFSRGGDALLSHKGTIGEVAVVPDEVELLILSPQVTYYRPSDELLAHYLVGMFRAEGFQRLLEKEAKQSTRAYIGITFPRGFAIEIWRTHPALGMCLSSRLTRSSHWRDNLQEFARN